MARARPTCTLPVLLLAACQHATGPSDDPALVRAPSPPPAAPACQPAPGPSGVIAWWRGDGDAADAAGDHDATPVGTVAFAPGRHGDAFLLDGTSWLEVPDHPGLDLASDFSLDLWFEHRSVGSWWFEGLVGKRDPASEVTNFGVSLNPSFLGIGPYYNDPAATGGDDFDQVGSTYEAVRVMPTPGPGAFHHLAAVYRQATVSDVELTLYLDGALARQRTIPGVLARTVNDAPLTLGASVPGFEAFTGLLDEIRLFDRALSSAEVAGLASGAAATTCQAQPLAIDLKPGDAANRVPCRNPNALVAVAVLGSPDFDVTGLDPSTAAFGPAGAGEVHRDRSGAARPHYEDANGDGAVDLVLHIRLGDSGLACGATEATLRIADRDGVSYEGTAPIDAR